MKRFDIEQGRSIISSHSGFALVGAALEKHTELRQQVDARIPQRHGIRPSDIIKSYLGLLSVGKSDFEALGRYLKSPFYREALNIKRIPSVERMRQRLDKHALDYIACIYQANQHFLTNANVELTPTLSDFEYIGVDVDTTPLDNSKTRKEGIARSNEGTMGYSPIAAYIGEEGYCLGFELREGQQHCQRDTPRFLESILSTATRITSKPLLLRMDGGHDSIENIDVVLTQCTQHPIDFIIKWNPRNQDVQHWLAYAKKAGKHRTIDQARQEWTFDVMDTHYYKSYEYTVRRVMRVEQRTMDKNGQVILIPEIRLHGWWTSLNYAPKTVIKFYAKHVTCEQFHSEFKTDLDVERLPSGRFNTNALVMRCTALIHNILRWMGQNILLGEGGPLRHQAKRRRIKTVLQEVMYIAAKVIVHAHRLKLVFSRYCQCVLAFKRLYHRLVYQ